MVFQDAAGVVRPQRRQAGAVKGGDIDRDTRRAEGFDEGFHHFLVKLGAAQLDQRGLAAVLGAVHHRRHRLVGGQFKGHEAQFVLADAVAHQRLIDQGDAIHPRFAGVLLEPVQHVPRPADDGASGALVLEQELGVSPALALFADEVFSGHLHVFQPHLIDVLEAVHGADRLDRHAGALHVDEQKGDAGLGLVVPVGAHQAEQPVGPLGIGGPYLLAVHHVMVAVLQRHGAQAGQIGPGARLGIALGPELLGGLDARQKALLLRVGAKGVDHRAHVLDAEGDHPRAAQAGQLVLEGEALQRRPALAAQLFGPVGHRPALLVEQTHPAHVVFLAQHLVAMGLVPQISGHHGGVEVAHLLAQALGLCSQFLGHCVPSCAIFTNWTP